MKLTGNVKGGTVEVSRLKGSRDGIQREDIQLFCLDTYLQETARDVTQWFILHRVKDKGISDLFNGATSTVFHFHHLSPCYGDKNKKLMRVISDDKSIRCNYNIDMNMIKIKCLVLSA